MDHPASNKRYASEALDTIIFNIENIVQGERRDGVIKIYVSGEYYNTSSFPSIEYMTNQGIAMIISSAGVHAGTTIPFSQYQKQKRGQDLAFHIKTKQPLMEYLDYQFDDNDLVLIFFFHDRWKFIFRNAKLIEFNDRFVELYLPLNPDA